MNALVAFVLGVLVGWTIYWLIFRIYWQRWRGYLEQDKTYLQSKLRAAEDIKYALERQITAQKGEQSGLHSKIAALERDNVRVLQQLEEAGADKNALVALLDALRAELNGCKKILTSSAFLNPAAQPLPAPHANGTNGKSHDPLPAMPYTNGKSHELLPAAAHSNGNTHELRPAAPYSNGKSQAPILAILDDDWPTPTPSINGNGTTKTDHSPRFTDHQPPTTDHFPRNSFSITTPQILEPILLIPRPRMDGDRLEIILGVTPALAKKFHQAGIVCFQAFANLTPEQLKQIVGTRAAKTLDAEGMIAQAKKLAEGRKR